MDTPPVIAHHIADFPTILRLVSSGVAAALVPDLATARVPDGVDVLDLKHPQHRVTERLHRRGR